MDSLDLTGGVTVVTGETGGIGFEMARGRARAGASIAVVGRDVGKSARALRELQAIGAESMAIEANVTESTALRRMAETTAERLGGIDILVAHRDAVEKRASTRSVTHAGHGGGGYE